MKPLQTSSASTLAPTVAHIEHPSAAGEALREGHDMKLGPSGLSEDLSSLAVAFARVRRAAGVQLRPLVTRREDVVAIGTATRPVVGEAASSNKKILVKRSSSN